MKKSHRSIIKIFFITLALSLITGCNDKKDRKKDDNTPERRGDELLDTDPVYFDTKPDINGDGSKVVFISARDGEMKAYKYDRDASARDRLNRVSDDDDEAGQEIEVAISPNGTWISFVALEEGLTNIYLKNFAGDIALVNVAATLEGAKSSLSFSSDSEYLLFTVRDDENFLRQTYAVKVNADGSVSSLTKLSNEAEGATGDEYAPVWVPVAGGASYRVDAKVRLTDSFATSLVSHTFTALTSITHASVLEDVKFAIDVPLAASEAALYFAEKNPLGEGEREQITVQGTNELDTKLRVATGASSLAVGATTAEDIESTAIEIVALSSSKDGSIGIWTVNEPLACPDNKLFFDASMLRFNKVTTTFDRLVIRGDPEEDAKSAPNYNWELVDDVCEAEGVKIDGNISFAKVSADSTLDSYSVVYTSYFIRDSEIRLMKVTNGTAEFYEVSDNLSPIP